MRRSDFGASDVDNERLVAFDTENRFRVLETLGVSEARLGAHEAGVVVAHFLGDVHRHSIVAVGSAPLPLPIFGVRFQVECVLLETKVPLDLVSCKRGVRASGHQRVRAQRARARALRSDALMP